MESQNKNAKKPPAPHTLPVFDDKKVEMHTMQQDMQKAHPEAITTMKNDQLKKDGLMTPSTPEPTTPETPKPEIPKPPMPPMPKMPEIESPMNPVKPLEKKPSPFDRFRKPKELKESAPGGMSKFKKMLPKTTQNEAEEPEVNQKDIPKGPGMPSMNIPKEEAPTPPQNDLEIKIPKESNKMPFLIAIVATLVVLVSGAGFGYYWFFVKEGAPTEIPQDTTTEQGSNVIQIPETQPAPITTPEPTPEAPKVVEIPEPQTPSSSIYFDQTAITTVSAENGTELVQALEMDAASIAGGGSVTRHLFKISNSQEKIFIPSTEFLKTIGVFIPADILSELSEVEFVSYKLDSKVRYGFIARISNKERVLSKMQSWETKMIQDMKQMFMGEPIIIPEDPQFAENTYLDFTKRYINLTDTELSLDYAVSDKYLIVATSKDMMFAAILQTQK